MFDPIFLLFSQPFSVGFLPEPVTDSSRLPGPGFKLPETLADREPLWLIDFASFCIGLEILIFEKLTGKAFIYQNC